MTPCPKCKRTETVNVVDTMEANRAFKARFCKECLVEFRKDGTIIPPVYTTKRLYALYKGKELLATGTIDEIAKKMGTKKSTIQKYNTKSYIHRLKQRNALNGNVRRLVQIEKDLSGMAVPSRSKQNIID